MDRWWRKTIKSGTVGVQPDITVSPSAQTIGKKMSSEVDQKEDPQTPTPQMLYGPTTVLEDRTSLTWHHEQCLTGRESDLRSWGESGIFSGRDDPFRHLLIESVE